MALWLHTLEVCAPVAVFNCGYCFVNKGIGVVTFT